MSELSGGNPREPLSASLIIRGLGYCCEHWFWEYFADVSSELIAARLGVAPRTVRKWRKRFTDGELSCADKPGRDCFSRRLRMPPSPSPPSGESQDPASHPGCT